MGRQPKFSGRNWGRGEKRPKIEYSIYKGRRKLSGKSGRKGSILTRKRGIQHHREGGGGGE